MRSASLMGPPESRSVCAPFQGIERSQSPGIDSVDEPPTGSGVADDLLSRVASSVTDRGVDTLRASVPTDSPGAQEFFTAHGPQGVREVIQAAGSDSAPRLFLDLKFHDIPNTVAGAVRAATALGPALLNVHASGGRAMMRAAADAAGEAALRHGVARPTLLAVTVLTSLDDGDLEEVVLVPCDDGVEAWVNRCTHEAQRFDTGRGVPMRGHQLICPRHGSLFDACDGGCDNGDAADTTLVSVDVAVDDGAGTDARREREVDEVRWSVAEEPFADGARRGVVVEEEPVGRQERV